MKEDFVIVSRVPELQERNTDYGGRTGVRQNAVFKICS
jgi:hypothetical protein